MQRFITHWLKRRKFQQLLTTVKQRRTDLNTVLAAVQYYDVSHYDSYRVTRGMTLHYQSLFNDAEHLMQTLHATITVVKQRGKFSDPAFKKTFERDFENETYLDSWLLNRNGESLHIQLFHRRFQSDMVDLITHLNRLRASGDSYFNYYTRYLSRLFEEAIRWFLVAELIGTPNDRRNNQRHHSS